MLIADREQMKAAYERSLSLDPNEPTGLQARADYRADYQADYAGALADVEAAIAAQPGSPALWNALALVHADRDAPREAEAAIQTSIALDPQDPLGHANRALLLVEHGRLDEAKREIDTALALDPSFDVARVALGRWHLQRGEMDAAITELLKGTTANPTYSNALLLLAAAYYQAGSIDPARQALDNADRLDPNDPVTSIVRTRIAIDDYEADVAIAAAREALARSKRRGGFFARLGENDDASFHARRRAALRRARRLGALPRRSCVPALRLLRLFRQFGGGQCEPLRRHPHLRLAEARLRDRRGRLLAAPSGAPVRAAGIASTTRRSQLLRAPFLDVETTFGGVSGDGTGFVAGATVQGYSNKPVPFSLYANVNRSVTDLDRSAIDDRGLQGTVILGAEPTPYDRFTVFAAGADDTTPWPGSLTLPMPLSRDRLTGARFGATWSHSFGWRNVANVAITGSDLSETADLRVTLDPFDLALTARREQTLVQAEANHMIGGEDWTLTYGARMGTVRERGSDKTVRTGGGLPPLIDETESRDEDRYARIYANLRYELTDDLVLEAGLGGTWTDEGRQAEITPRIGAAWSFYDDQWLRAFYRRDVLLLGYATIEPVETVNLRGLEAPLDVGSVVDSAGAVWDAEWSDRVFTSIEYQHQWFGRFSILNPATIDSYDFAEGELDRVAATVNLQLGAASRPSAQRPSPTATTVRAGPSPTCPKRWPASG